MSIVHGQLICDVCGLPIATPAYRTDIVDGETEHYHTRCRPVEPAVEIQEVKDGSNL